MLRTLNSINPSNYPQFGFLAAPPLLADSKWRYAVVSLALGSVAILFLGQPTLFQIFSKALEVQLWDTEEIIRNNLIAIGIVLGILVLWKKLRPNKVVQVAPAV